MERAYKLYLLCFCTLFVLNTVSCAYVQAGCNPDGPRKDCGYPGITQKECEYNNCCWHVRWGSPFCFHPNTKVCVGDAARKDCGYPGIDEFTCTVKRDCCWDTSVKDVPWCFYRNGQQE